MIGCIQNLFERAYAADSINIQGINFVSGDNITNVKAKVGNVIDNILVVAGVLAIIYFIYSGILFITAAGNPDKVKKGQQGLIYAAIGIAVVVLSYFIVTAVANMAADL